MTLFIHWLVSSLAIMVTALIIPGASVGFGSSLLAAIILGLVNIFIKPILVFLTLPVNILTLGLFSLVINGVVIMIVSALTPGFKVGGFGTAILFALVLAIINIIALVLSGY